MIVTGDHLDPTTIPISIAQGSIIGQGTIHYNSTTYEILTSDLTIRVTTIPHIWPEPTPKLVSKGQCVPTIPDR